MTERKPAGVSFETWVDRQFREALVRPPEGPPLNLTPFDIDAVVGEWRAGRRGH